MVKTEVSINIFIQHRVTPQTEVKQLGLLCFELRFFAGYIFSLIIIVVRPLSQTTSIKYNHLALFP